MTTMTGTRIIKFCIVIASLLLTVNNAKGQEFGFSILAYPSAGYNLVLEPGMNGGGASLFYNGQRNKKLNLSLSAEYAMTTWGHQSFVGIGVNRTWVSWDRFELNTTGHFINGLAFYRPQSLYVFGVDTRISANFYIYQDLKVFLGTGIRFTLCPGYREYGLIETSLDIPVELGIKIPLKIVRYRP